MKYVIEQYPKYKNVDFSNLSQYQILIRKNEIVTINKDDKKCKKCLKVQPLKEFYIKDKKTGRRSNSCRDCQIKECGVLEVGKIRYSKKIFKKGFRRCSVCKNIKPLSDYSRSSTYYGGYSSNCYECSNRLHSEYFKKQKNEIGDFYVKQYGILKGISDFTESVIEELRNEIIEKRKPLYFLDEKEFMTVEDFSNYIESKYGISSTAVKKRIYFGEKEIECTIEEKEYRSLKSGTNKGIIRVTDTVTNEVFYFKNTRDKELLKMFSASSINEALKTKLPIGGKRSKYINACLIERI